MFLKFNEHEILGDPGKVMKEVADKLALGHYEVFNRKRLAEEAAKEAIEDDADGIV
ncbi:MAG: hypothetical protein KKB12_03430 [Candidatus Omnitrophica bacterium]|nr:hypothetical protein [Candidatus Omnitrophota bacterium]MBU1657197.1 hypothetical protein [Candidatus Omnitrophota bacterium]